MAKIYRLGNFVGQGEQRAAAYLEQALPASWAVICNKELVNPDRSVREVDFIVVADRAVFVLEEKSWSGPIHGNENGWVLRGSESFESPLRVSEYVAKRLAGLLRANVPLLRDQVRGHFVHPRVLLSSDGAKLFVREPRVSHVLRLDECAEELKRDDRLQPEPASIKLLRQKIIQHLTQLPDRPPVPREIGDYRVREVLPPVGDVRAFRAHHVDGSERLLKLVSVPETADLSLREREENALLRDYRALQTLADTGCVPRVDPRFSWDQGHYWVYPVHPVSGRSLRADRLAAEPSREVVLRTARDAFEGLNRLHSAGVLHRALNPDRVHLRPDGRVMFSDFLIARIAGELTIADTADRLDVADHYRAPECRISLAFAEPASDVYGLAASLLHWITGLEPEETGPAYPEPETAFAETSSALPPEARRVLTECLREDERVRPSVEEVLAALVPPPAPRTQERSELQPDEIIADQYRIVRVLGRGGSAVTYLADDTISGLRFVLKTIHNPELIARLSTAEFRVLLELHHPNLPRVYDIKPSAHPYHLKLEYVPGVALRDLMRDRQGDRELALRVLDDVLEALVYLGNQRILHRDVSPGNILVPEDETAPIRLIDFGLATNEAEALSAVGTPRYRAPEVERGRTWSVAADLYALAAVVYELLTGRPPYKDGSPRKTEPDHPTQEERTRFGSLLLDLLLRAASPDPALRPQSARDMRDAVADATLRAGTAPAPVAGKEEINLHVAALRGAYRNSRIGNADNRGLDSRFALDTYVPTRLDRELLPRVLKGDFRLVVLSGNPGDGKTAFLQQVRGALSRAGAVTQAEDEAGWRLHLDERTFAAVYDASEAAGERSADDLLAQALDPLAGEQPGAKSYTALVAANDGRLLDFFERHGYRYPWLWSRLQPRLFSGSSVADPTVALVDLKRRSLVGLDVSQGGLADAVLDQFVAPERWHVCEGCVARLECPMRLNALTFRDSSLGVGVRSELRRLLLASHFRREHRATIRDLRSALSYLITHDLSCEEVHAERHDGRVPASDPARLYFNTAFTGAGAPDVLLDEWRSFDPAPVALPKLDRWLYVHRDLPDSANSALAKSAERPLLPIRAGTLPPEDAVSVLKRRYAFESAGLPALPAPTDLLPYRHFARFIEALRTRPEGEGNDDQPDQQVTESLFQLLLQGISRADGVPLEASRDGLALRTSDGHGIVVIKRFTATEFDLQVPPSSDVLVEETPDRIELIHRPSRARLLIGLDLFEFVMRASDGYLPGPEEQGALAEELVIYKNRLLGQTTQDVVLLEGGRKAWGVRSEDGTIRLERAYA